MLSTALVMDGITRAMSVKAGFDALHWLVVVMKNDGHFSRAAEQLGVSQSAVSQRMNALKKRHGEIFTRDTHSVQLTQAGRMLHDSAEQAFTEIQITERRVEALRSAKAASERLRVAYSPSHVATVMTAIAEVLGERGGLTITVEEAEPAIVAAKLHDSNGPELGIAYFPSSARRGLEGNRVSSKPMALVTNRLRHPHLAKLATVHAADLRKEPMALLQKGPIRKLINEYFRGGAPERILLESNMVASLLAATRVGFASTILPEFEEDATFAVRPLEPPIIPDTYLLWNVRARRTEAALAFAEAVKRAAVP